MMMVVKCLQVETYQYYPILDNPHLKNVVRGRYLSEIEFKQAHNYVLFNCDKLRLFIRQVYILLKLSCELTIYLL